MVMVDEEERLSEELLAALAGGQWEESPSDLLRALDACHADDAAGFIVVLRKLGRARLQKSHADTICALVQNAQLAHYRDGESKAACEIAGAYAGLITGGLPHGQHHCEAIATSLAIAQLSGDDQLASIVIESLLPEPIEHPCLAFNLACYAAVKGHRERVLRYSRLALRLGKSKDQFREESDFGAYQDDDEFRDLVS